MRSKLIANPRAGRKAGLPTNGATLDAALTALAGRDNAPDVEMTRGPGHATELARAAARAGYDRVIAAGGDGTVRETAVGLLGSGATLGIMPLGSFMNVAHMLAIPRDVREAAAVIAGGEQAVIDMGRAGEHYFLEAAGVGLDAALFRQTNRLDAGHWDALGTAARIALTYRPQRLVVEMDCWTVEMDALMVTVANGPYCGAALTVAPGAVVDDHRLDVRVYGPMSPWSLFRRLARPPSGDGDGDSDDAVSSFKARDVRISAPHPLPGHADSVSIGVTPLRFSLIPGALTVLVPADMRSRHAALSHPPVHTDTDLYAEASS